MKKSKKLDNIPIPPDEYHIQLKCGISKKSYLIIAMLKKGPVDIWQSQVEINLLTVGEISKPFWGTVMAQFAQSCVKSLLPRVADEKIKHLSQLRVSYDIGFNMATAKYVGNVSMDKYCKNFFVNTK